MPKPIERLDVEVRLDQIKIPHLFDDSQRNEVEHCFEFEEEIRTWSLLVEVHKGKRSCRSTSKNIYSG